MAKIYKIQLESADRQMTVRALIAALERVLQSLRDLDPNLRAEWQAVKIRLRPPVTFIFENPNANGSVSKSIRNIRSVGAPPSQQRPISAREVESVREIASLFAGGFTAVKIAAKGKRPVTITPEVAKAVEAIGKTMKESSYREWTTIRGQLDQITAPEDGDVRFRLTSRVRPKGVRCSFKPELMEEVKAALRHRVEISGRATVAHGGDVYAIDVHSIRTLQDDLPPFDSEPPVDITGDMDTTEYLERLRGDDEAA